MIEKIELHNGQEILASADGEIVISGSWVEFRYHKRVYRKINTRYVREVWYVCNRG